MGLIDDHRRREARAEAIEQEIGQGQPHFLLAFGLIGQLQIVEDGLEQSGPVAHMAVGEEGGAVLRPETFEQAMAQQRLAGAWFAGEDEDPFAVGQAGQQAVDRLLVPGRRVVRSRVRRGRERPLPQPEALDVHVHSIPVSTAVGAVPHLRYRQKGKKNSDLRRIREPFPQLPRCRDRSRRRVRTGTAHSGACRAAQSSLPHNTDRGVGKKRKET